jgi:hypothetical protein
LDIFGGNSVRLYRDGQISNHHKSCIREEDYKLMNELKAKALIQKCLSFIVILMDCGIVENPLSMGMFGIFAG